VFFAPMTVWSHQQHLDMLGLCLHLLVSGPHSSSKVYLLNFWFTKIVKRLIFCYVLIYCFVPPMLFFIVHVLCCVDPRVVSHSSIIGIMVAQESWASCHHGGNSYSGRLLWTCTSGVNCCSCFSIIFFPGHAHLQMSICKFLVHSLKMSVVDCCFLCSFSGIYFELPMLFFIVKVNFCVLCLAWNCPLFPFSCFRG